MSHSSKEKRRQLLEQLLAAREAKASKDDLSPAKPIRSKKDHLYVDLRHTGMRHFATQRNMITPEHAQHVKEKHDPTSEDHSDKKTPGPDLLQVDEKDKSAVKIASNVMNLSHKLCESGKETDLYFITLDAHHTNDGQPFTGMIGTSSQNADQSKSVKVLPIDFTGDDDNMRKRELHGQVITALSSMRGTKDTVGSDPLEPLSSKESDSDEDSPLYDRHPTKDAFLHVAKKGGNIKAPDMVFTVLGARNIREDHKLVPALLNQKRGGNQYKSYVHTVDALPPGATPTAVPNGGVGYSVPPPQPQQQQGGGGFFGGITNILGMIAPLVGMFL